MLVWLVHLGSWCVVDSYLLGQQSSVQVKTSRGPFFDPAPPAPGAEALQKLGWEMCRIAGLDLECFSVVGLFDVPSWICYTSLGQVMARSPARSRSPRGEAGSVPIFLVDDGAARFMLRPLWKTTACGCCTTWAKRMLPERRDKQFQLQFCPVLFLIAFARPRPRQA